MLILNNSFVTQLNKDSIILKALRKSSNTKNIYTFDIYYLKENMKQPLLIQTPTLTITSNILYQNNYTNLLLALRNIEYDVDIQKFYLLLTKIEYIITQHLLSNYEISEDYKSFQILDKSEQLNNTFNLFINTDKCVSLCVNIKKDVTNVFNRFKNKYEMNEILKEGNIENPVLKKNTRAQFILELPTIWFEVEEIGDIQKIKRIGFNWSALQIKILEQCAIETCLIEDEIKAPLKSSIPPPPPPPPPPPMPGMGLMGLKRINPMDLLGGINNLKKIDNDSIVKPKKELKPKNTNGFKPPSLDDILNTLKKMKNKQ